MELASDNHALVCPEYSGWLVSLLLKFNSFENNGIN